MSSKKINLDWVKASLQNINFEELEEAARLEEAGSYDESERLLCSAIDAETVLSVCLQLKLMIELKDES